MATSTLGALRVATTKEMTSLVNVPSLATISSASSEDIALSEDEALVQQSDSDAIVYPTDAGVAVSHVGYGLSDVSFAFGNASSGAQLGQWASAGGCNAFGERGVVKAVSSRAGAAGECGPRPMVINNT